MQLLSNGAEHGRIPTSSHCLSSKRPNDPLQTWPTTMHPIWHITEIRLLVLEQLCGQDLASMAQTCSTLFHPATDVLWRKIDSYLPLLACLPSHYADDPLTTDDLHRQEMYGFSIREVQVDQSRINVNTYRPPALQYLPGGKPCSRKTWAELWEEIRMLRPAGQFLPNLRRVHIYTPRSESIIPFVGVSGARLSSLRVHGS